MRGGRRGIERLGFASPRRACGRPAYSRSGSGSSAPGTRVELEVGLAEEEAIPEPGAPELSPNQRTGSHAKLHGHQLVAATHMVVEVEAVRRATPSGKPFIDETFLYLDDNPLGLFLWSRGCKVKYVPLNAGTHFAGMTAGGAAGAHYWLRASTALLHVVRTRYSLVQRHRSLRRRLSCLFDETRYKAVREGVELGRKLAAVIGTANLYCAPYVEVDR